jgi:hypothetical protein
MDTDAAAHHGRAREHNPPGAPTYEPWSRAWQLRSGPSTTALTSRNQLEVAAVTGLYGDFKLSMNSCISRRTSDSFERNMWCEPGTRTTRAVGTRVSIAFSCF